jgi:hypothetical protein
MLNKIVLLVMVVILAACATHYSSVNKREVSGYEIVVCNEKEILDAAYEAIERRFPDTSITQLAGNKTGYSFYAQPLIDRTTFDFVVNRVEGMSGDKKVIGYIYSIKSYGTQFFVDGRYIEPLIQEFENVLMKKNILLVRSFSIRYFE